MSAINEAFDLRKLANAWHDKAQAAHDLHAALKEPAGPYQGARFSPYYGASAVFSASAEATTFLKMGAEASDNYRKGHQSRRCESLSDLKEIAAELAEYHRAIEQAVKAVARAMVVEDAVEAGKDAARKSETEKTDAAIVEEVEAVWYIRDIFNGKDTRALLGISR